MFIFSIARRYKTANFTWPERARLRIFRFLNPPQRALVRLIAKKREIRREKVRRLLKASYGETRRAPEEFATILRHVCMDFSNEKWVEFLGEQGAGLLWSFIYFL